jgi:predicted GNAT family N-acyltransferase
MGKIASGPMPLEIGDDLIGFDCGEDSLNQWLQRTAHKNHKSGASRVFTIKDNAQVIGYYCLAAGSIARVDAPKKMVRNSPDPLPIILLGRLAIDNRYKGQGLGGFLLRDAILRSTFLAKNIGVVAIIAHALNQSAKEFYLQYGFLESPLSDMTLILPLKNLAD